MLLSKGNLEVMRVVPKDSVDERYQGVWIGEDGSTVGSNGRATVAVSPPGEDSYFPEELGASYGKGCLLSKGAISTALRNLEKTNRFSRVLVSSSGEGVRLTSVDSAGEAATLNTIPLGANFPEWGRPGKYDGKVAVSLRELVDVLQTLDKVCPDKTKITQVYLTVSIDGVLLRTKNLVTGQRVVGVVVPNPRLEREWLPFSRWERRLFVVDLKG